MELKHTPGPWAYGATAGNHDFAVYSESEGTGRDIALVRDFDEANAKLIAAAPEMLDRLSRLVESCYDAGHCHVERCGCTYCDDLRAANELVQRVE